MQSVKRSPIDAVDRAWLGLLVHYVGNAGTADTSMSCRALLVEVPLKPRRLSGTASTTFASWYGRVARGHTGRRIVRYRWSLSGASAARPKPAGMPAAPPARVRPVRSTRPCFGCPIHHLSRRSFLVAQARELRPKRVHVHDEARTAWNRVDAARGYAHELLVVSRRSALENLDCAQRWID